MDATQPDWMETLDHTADTGLLVRAGGVAELFARAALGMFRLIADLSQVRPLKTVRVAAEAPDREALLVRWLSELNFLHQTENMLFCEFDVEECGESSLKASACGEQLDTERHRLYNEIKAVTFHGLRIEQTGAVWEAQVLFDI